MSIYVTENEDRYISHTLRRKSYIQSTPRVKYKDPKFRSRYLIQASKQNQKEHQRRGIGNQIKQIEKALSHFLIIWRKGSTTFRFIQGIKPHLQSGIFCSNSFPEQKRQRKFQETKAILVLSSDNRGKTQNLRDQIFSVKLTFKIGGQLGEKDWYWQMGSKLDQDQDQGQGSWEEEDRVKAFLSVLWVHQRGKEPIDRVEPRVRGTVS